jgi:cell division protein FtsQ
VSELRPVRDLDTPTRRRGLEARPPRIPLPPEETPFLRPKHRTRARRGRRGLLGRAVLAVQLAGALVLTAGAVWGAYSRVMASERLQVNRVDVRGSHFLSEREVRDLLGPAVGENILGLDIEGLKARLRASPWVADAAVRRTLPDTLEVEIHERVPLALAEVDRLYLMDSEGLLIDIYGPRTVAFDLPIVRGLVGVDAETRRDRAARAGALLRDLGELAREISEVRVEDTGDLRVALTGPGEVLLMGAPPYRKRFLTFLGLRAELRSRCPTAEYFDLRFRDRIYAKQADAEQPRAPAAAEGVHPGQ